MEIVIGMFGVLLGIGVFILGFWFGREMGQPKKVESSDPTDEEIHQIQEERKRLIEDQKAFRELMNYNPDIAYGVDKEALGL